VTHLLRRLSGARGRRTLRVAGTVALLLSANGTAIRAGGQTPASPSTQKTDQAASPDGQARFRAEANYVRVDVFPTLNGQTVRDLTQADFELLEDGVPQRIQTFEHVTVRGPGPDAFRREPTSTSDSRELAESGRSRIIVIFLDTYHVDFAGSHRMQRTLVNLLNRVVGPDDLFAVMTPQMSAKDIALARRTETVEGYLSRYWFWGQRDKLYPDDPIEQEYVMCYPDKTPDGARTGTEAFQGVADEMIARRREKQVLDALDDLSKYLRGLRDERKAVITVTGGWVLFRENPNLTRNGRTEPQLAGVTPDGRLTADRQEYNVGFDRRHCERDRMNLAMLNNWQTFHDLVDDANRSNVSFYPVNALGLVALDKPIYKDELLEGEAQALVATGHPMQNLAASPIHGSQAVVASRSENLRTLAENTDGLAVVDTNDLDKGIKRVVDDLTSYYLLGYYATNTKLDGKFRKITVRVKRPNVDVRARRGYRAATREEIEAGKMTAATAEAAAPPAMIQVALNSLGSARPGVPLRTSVSYASLGPDEGTERRVHLWALTELDSSVVRAGEWLAGGSINVAVLTADNEVLTETTTPLPAGQRALAVDLGEVVVPEHDVTIRTRVTPAQQGLPYSDTIRLAEISAPGRPVVLRRGPTTGIKFLPTADLQFRRTERVRLELPTAATVTATSGEVLDRAGKTMPLTVTATTRTEAGITWASAELNLAPLAAGDYILKLKAEAAGKTEEVVTGFRLVP
jgi:VWFA-related protein